MYGVSQASKILQFVQVDFEFFLPKMQKTSALAVRALVGVGNARKKQASFPGEKVMYDVVQTFKILPVSALFGCFYE